VLLRWAGLLDQHFLRRAPRLEPIRCTAARSCVGRRLPLRPHRHGAILARIGGCYGRAATQGDRGHVLGGGGLHRLEEVLNTSLGLQGDLHHAVLPLVIRLVHRAGHRKPLQLRRTWTMSHMLGVNTVVASMVWPPPSTPHTQCAECCKEMSAKCSDRVEGHNQCSRTAADEQICQCGLALCRSVTIKPLHHLGGCI
jgi:hypothetical protein